MVFCILVVYSNIIMLCFKKRTKNLKQVRDTFFQGLKIKQIIRYLVSQYGLGTWEAVLSKEYQHWHPGKGCICSLFLT